MKTKRIELIRVGELIAEVEIELHDDAGDWSPAISLDDARKLDAVRAALVRNDMAAAEKAGRVYRMLRVSA